MSGNDAKNIGIGVLIGAAVGLAVGFLYAPRPGRETRTMIAEKARAIKDRIRKPEGEKVEA
ncbi:MAG: YtxH domain-containing protein [Chloroflexi bacterium]|nr:YtxH domain-containing protein [Chloroflexota bacterium]